MSVLVSFCLFFHFLVKGILQIYPSLIGKAKRYKKHIGKLFSEVFVFIHAAGARVYALQQARSEGTTGEFDVVAPGWDAACERMAERIEALGWDRFTYRPA